MSPPLTSTMWQPRTSLRGCLDSAVAYCTCSGFFKKCINILKHCISIFRRLAEVSSLILWLANDSRDVMRKFNAWPDRNRNGGFLWRVCAHTFDRFSFQPLSTITVQYNTLNDIFYLFNNCNTLKTLNTATISKERYIHSSHYTEEEVFPVWDQAS